MKTTRDADNRIHICGLTPHEAGLVQSAALGLAERTGDRSHARTLRRLSMQLDEQLPSGGTAACGGCPLECAGPDAGPGCIRTDL